MTVTKGPHALSRRKSSPSFKMCSSAALVRLTFSAIIVFVVVGMLRMHSIVVLQNLEGESNSSGGDNKSSSVSKISKRSIMNDFIHNPTLEGQALVSERMEAENSALAWATAINEAQKMLQEAASKNDPSHQHTSSEHIHDSWKAECLIPTQEKTEELVHRLVSEHSTKPVQSSSIYDNAKKFVDPLVPLPILNVGMPKLGSTSLFYYFNCKGLNATHWNLNVTEFEGLCMRDAARVNLPPLATCAPHTHAITQMDVAFPMGSAYGQGRVPNAFQTTEKRDDCFFPQLSLLEAIHNESPNATLILTFRPMADWTKSILNWYSMLERLQQCHLPNLPRGTPAFLEKNHTSELEETMTRFFCSHVLHVRNFVAKYPSHNLIELDLYDPRTPILLDQLFPSSPTVDDITNIGSNSSCWDQYKGGVKGRAGNRTRMRERRAKRAKIEKQKQLRQQRQSK